MDCRGLVAVRGCPGPPALQVELSRPKFQYSELGRCWAGDLVTRGYETVRVTGSTDDEQVKGRVTFTNTNIPADEFADYVATPGACQIPD